MSHYDDVVAADCAFFWQKITPQENWDSLNVEKARRRCSSLHDFRMAGGGKAESVAVLCDQILKDSVLTFPIEVISDGNGVVVPVDSRPDHDELMGIWIWQRREKGGIDHGKNGSVCAYTESEGKNGNGGKGRGLSQHTQTEAQIPEQDLEKGN